MIPGPAPGVAEVRPDLTRGDTVSKNSEKIATIKQSITASFI